MNDFDLEDIEDDESLPFYEVIDGQIVFPNEEEDLSLIDSYL